MPSSPTRSPTSLPQTITDDPSTRMSNNTAGAASRENASKETAQLSFSAAPAPTNFYNVASSLAPLGATAGNEGHDGRRSTVQFSAHGKGMPTGSPKQRASQSTGRGRRMSSPPPPPVFHNRVSFDTFDNRDASDFSLTLNRKHKDYEYTKRSRTFLCGTDMNDYSEFALEWLVDELVDDGDEIVCLRVVEKDSKLAGDASIEKGRYKKEAEEMMRQIQSKNTENKAISLILEFSVGKVQDTIQQMIRIYEPAILVVGTRGRNLGGFQGLLPGSVSKYCLQHSPVPVIVVRPNAKREKKKRKRLQDPSRHGYKDILDKSGATLGGGHLLDLAHRNSLVGTSEPASEAEAAAVADAIGYKPAIETAGLSNLSKVVSVRSDTTTATSPDSPYLRADSPDDLRNSAVLMKSPEYQNLESPELSEDESNSDDIAERNFGNYPLTGTVSQGELGQQRQHAESGGESAPGRPEDQGAGTETVEKRLDEVKLDKEGAEALKHGPPSATGQ